MDWAGRRSGADGLDPLLQRRDPSEQRAAEPADLSRLSPGQAVALRRVLPPAFTGAARSGRRLHDRAQTLRCRCVVSLAVPISAGDLLRGDGADTDARRGDHTLGGPLSKQRGTDGGVWIRPAQLLRALQCAPRPRLPASNAARALRKLMAHAITSLRLLAVAPAAWAFSRPGSAPGWLLAVLVVVAIASDYVDGIVARRTGSASPAGMLFDHTTDCLFVTAGLAGASTAGLIPMILPVLVPVAFVQYVLDSYFLHRQRQLRMSTLGRWNGI